MAKPANTIKPERRSNVERTAETQRKVIKAAIASIYEVGYEGTSIKIVADRAGVSKGAAQHHYTSKTEMMFAVAEYCFNYHVKIRRDIYNKFEPGPERISHTAEASWKIINHPSYTALIEIMMATRNNKELKLRCRPLVKSMAEERKFGAQAFYNDFNVEPNDLVPTLIRTHVTAMRGISIGMMFNGDKKAFREEMEMMQKYERLMTDMIVEKYGKK